MYPGRLRHEYVKKRPITQKQKQITLTYTCHPEEVRENRGLIFATGTSFLKHWGRRLARVRCRLPLLPPSHRVKYASVQRAVLGNNKFATVRSHKPYNCCSRAVVLSAKSCGTLFDRGRGATDGPEGDSRSRGSAADGHLSDGARASRCCLDVERALHKDTAATGG